MCEGSLVSPLTFTSVSMELNSENIRAWYEDDRIYMYEIRGLGLEEPYNTSPCSGTSRWEYVTGTCSSPTVFEDTDTYNTLHDALADSTDPNPYVRDIVLQGDNCIADEYTIGAQIQVGTKCFTHVHPDLHNVYDFSYWVQIHDGNESAYKNGRPNPIARWAELGLTYLEFPWHHPVSRWAARNQYFTLAGRLGDWIAFNSLPTAFQTESMATSVGALGSRSDYEESEACGSPNEFENDPALGDRYHLADNTYWGLRTYLLDNSANQWQGKQTVWYNVLLNAPDQLRQRVAWALFQMIPISDIDMNNEGVYAETWVNYYDIFVRNAFGNYRDILQEVSYNPLMARYLSFWGNRAYTRTYKYPDENYAREIMQLFSVGLWLLEEDGSRVLDEQGQPIATYTNDDILDYARLWTGFDAQSTRSNTELYGTSSNGVDPMQLKPDYHDLLPKAKLSQGYLGDRYPNCYELPSYHWLKRGATYIFTGESSVEGPTMDAESPTESGFTGRFTAPPTSALYEVLCRPDETGRCTFPSKIVLQEDLPCENSAECQSQMIISVKVVDQLDTTVVRYYTYQTVTCSKLTFFDQGAQMTTGSSGYQCAAPSQPVGRIICCRSTSLSNPVAESNRTCLFANEAVDLQTAASRCEAVGYTLCTSGWTSWTRSCAADQFSWLNRTCSLSIQVYPSGRVAVVDPIAASVSYDDFRILKESSGNVFRVRWDNGDYPMAASGCPEGCTEVTSILGQTCLCNFTVTDTIVYTELDQLPSRSEILETLFQGAVNPAYGDELSLCTTCTFPEGVRVWLSASGQLDADSIFEVENVLAGRPTYYLRNRLSTVSVGSYAFRNPPRFMQGAGELNSRWKSWNPADVLVPAAENDVEDLLDHLFEHQSTAPFVAYRMIQRLVTSNPSPRYMRSVVQAFRTGTYNGITFSGVYGDMAATIAAVLLDREARTPMLEMDPTFGVMREPMLKMWHAIRGLEMNPVDEREILFNTAMYSQIGMEAYHSPSVFGFYLPENRPEGPLNDLAIVSPEAQLAITPNLFGILNNFVSLVDDGFTPCSFGGRTIWVDCRWPSRYLIGTMDFAPENATDPSEVVDELDLVLTGRRLASRYKEHIIARYNQTLLESTPEEALKLAEKLVLLSPEFHVTNAQQSVPENPRLPAAEIPSQHRPYKAIVLLIEEGGVDSFNVIIPHSNCGSFDLRAEYETVRDGAAVPLGSLLPISVPSGTQPCDTFGLYPSFTNLKDMYDEGEVAFFANMGALVEPITKEEYNARPLLKVLPPSLFAHNIMTRNSQNLHPQNAAAAGVLGRIVTAMRQQEVPYRSEIYSLTGMRKAAEGGNPDYVSSTGITQFSQYDELASDVAVMSELMAESPMAETYLELLTSSLNRTERMGDLFETQTLNATFPTGVSLGRQLATAAKLMKMRSSLETERDVFVVSTGGFDTHGTFDLDPMFSPIDDSLQAFREEMIAQGIWDQVAVLTISEFARTLTTNGAGTDHGWGGNYFLVGGAVQGGQILGHYPDRLTEDGAAHIGRGRLLPTTSYDAVWKGLAQWFGVTDEQLTTVLPNLPNFPDDQLFTQEDLFR